MNVTINPCNFGVRLHAPSEVPDFFAMLCSMPGVKFIQYATHDHVIKVMITEKVVDAFRAFLDRNVFVEDYWNEFVYVEAKE